MRLKKNKYINFNKAYTPTYLDNSPSFLSEFSNNTDDGIVTQALVLVEGVHVDNKQRKHTFTKDRIQKIADNSNAAFNNGVQIPLLKDHNKGTEGYCGDVTDEFIVRPVQEDDIPSTKRDKLSHLVGKLAVFANGIAVKTKDAIDKYKSGLKTISPGIDVMTDTIREISITPIPAIPGMSLFNAANNRPLTWEEQDTGNVKLEELKGEYNELSDQFFNLIENIYTASENELEDRDPNNLILEALDEYFNRLMELLGMNEDMGQDQQMEDPYAMAQQQMMMQNQQVPMAYGQGQMANMSRYSLFNQLAQFERR